MKTNNAKPIFTILILLFHLNSYASDKITERSLDVDKGKTKVLTNKEFIEEVSVVAKDIIRKADRDVIVMNPKYTNQATSAEQVLQGLPMISMNLVSRSFRVANKDRVLLQVDGIVKDEQYIRSLSPSKIERVEIISEASGRNANDYDVVLNIITEESMKGYSVYAEDYSMLSLEDSYNNILKNNIRANYSYHDSKVNIYGGYANNYSRMYVPEEKMYRTSGGINGGAKDNLFSSSINDIYVGGDFKLAADKVLSAEVRYSNAPIKKNKYDNFGTGSLYDDDGYLLAEYYSQAYLETSNNNTDISVNYKGNVGRDNTINTGVSYSFNQNWYYNNNGWVTKGDEDKRKLDVYIEDEWQVNKQSAIELNYNYSYINTETNHIYTDESYAINANSYCKNNIGVYWNHSINEKSVIKVGIGFEHVSIKNEIEENETKKHKLVVLPYLSYHYQVSDSLNLRLNYTVNTVNPTMSQLTPRTFFIDTYTVITGNTLLTPSYHHEIKGSLEVGNIVFQPFYGFGNDAVSSVLSYEDFLSQYYTYANVLDYKQYGFYFMWSRFNELKNNNRLHWTFNMKKYWESASYLSNNHSLSDCEVSAEISYYSYKRDFVLAMEYQKNNVKHITAQGYIRDDIDYLALSLKKELFKNYVDFRLSYITPFKPGFSTRIGSVTDTEDFYRSDFKEVSVIQNSFIFQLVYKFDKNTGSKVSKFKRKSIDIDHIKTGLL